MSLVRASAHARAGQLAEMRAVCIAYADENPTDVVRLLDAGTLLSQFGFLADARVCYTRAQALAQTDLRATINLANLARDAGEHAQARHLYAQLLQALPEHPVIRRNALTCLEYDPEVPDAERLMQTQAWGAWAIARAGGDRPRPVLRPLDKRPLRLGYVSADFCQSTPSVCS